MGWLFFSFFSRSRRLFLPAPTKTTNTNADGGKQTKPSFHSDESGGCWYLPPDPSGELAQIDLSDDGVVAQLFASHVWEDLLEPLDVADGSGGGNGGNGGGGGGGNGGEQPSQVRQLRLSEGEFRAVLSLVRGSSALPSERLELQRERR